MHDLVIRGGTVIDGTGASSRTADVAIANGVIVAVGKDVGAANRVVDADGLLVTPGFVDIHTHYDGQATWDPFLTPSSWHGVTTAVFGNCGVGFAPVRPGTTDYLINLMEGVEDIPGTVLAEGVSFAWESFPQYLDALAAMPRAIDIGAQVPHAALRFYVMGERGAEHAEAPNDSEMERMGALLEESLRAGALGFTTSRTTKHKARDGRLTPSLSAREPELFALARAMKRAGRGVLEVNSDFGPGEFEALRAASEISGRPLSCLLVQVQAQPDLWRETLAQIHAARADGLAANAQVGSRAIGVLMGLDTSVHPFLISEPWRSLARLPHAERVARIRADAELRRALIAPPPEGKVARLGITLDRVYPLVAQLDYEPDASMSVAAMARRDGRDARELALELLMADDGTGLLMHPFENYSGGDLEVVREMLTDEATVLGVADGGAHVGTICDASSPTTLLTHWGRDRRRGEKLPLEFLVKRQSRDTAMAYGLSDRGLLAPGMKADINVIDFDRLRVLKPRVAYDLPAGGKRLVQRAEGYRHVFVAGAETLSNDEHTGALPGKLVR
ncbi:MAG: amidohydrolase family protein [Alphaproteobacteria bacterium]|nr:amidohydrolase family protein [Alphaproteobacteria bacterium]